MPSSSHEPRKRPSAAVYRRRRLVAAVLAALVLLLAGWGLGALVNSLLPAAGGDAETSPSAAPTPVSSPTPARASASGLLGQDDADVAALPACAPTDLRVVASADRDAYLRGQEAVLHLGVTNLSARPCRADVGTAVQEFRIEDAEGGQVLSTRVCQADPTHQEVALEPGDQQRAVYRWDGRTSSPDCTRRGGLTEPGRYALTVSLGDVSSRPVALTVLEERAPATASPTPSATASPSPSASPSATAPAPSPESGGSPSRAASPTSPAPGTATPAPASSLAAPTPSAPTTSATPAPAAPAPASTGG